MGKGKRYRDSDPTSSAAIGNVTREAKQAVGTPSLAVIHLGDTGRSMIRGYKAEDLISIAMRNRTQVGRPKWLRDRQAWALTTDLADVVVTVAQERHYEVNVRRVQAGR